MYCYLFVYLITYLVMKSPEDVCQSHFIGYTEKKSLEENVIKITTNTITKNNGEDVINFKNNTTTEFQYINMSKIHEIIGKDKNVKINKSIDNINGSLLKKNDSLFGQSLILNNSSVSEEKHIISLKNINSGDNLENKTVTSRRNKRELMEDCQEFPNPKNFTVQMQSTTVTNENITNNLQVNDDIANVTTNSDNITKIFDNLTTITENMTKITQTYDNMDKNLQNHHNETEILQNSQNNTEEVNENDLLKNVQNNDTHKSYQNHETPKHLKKRDTGIKEQMPNVYNSEELQKLDATNHRHYDLYKNIDNYDLPRNTEPNDPRNIAQNNMEKVDRELNKYRPFNENYKVKYKNKIDKTDVLRKDENSKVFNDNYKIIPQIQTRLNSDLVKKSFDEFKMVRRKTHYTIPDIQVQNDNGKHDNDRYQNLAYNLRFLEYYDDGKNGRRKRVATTTSRMGKGQEDVNMQRQSYYVEPNYHSKDDLQTTYQEGNRIYPFYDEFEPKVNYKELNKVLTRQKEIIQKLTQLQSDGRKQNSPADFEKIMSEIEEKRKWRNYTDFQFETTRITTTKLTTTQKPTTILALFDETEIRIALKKDPQVRRLLKIGNLKREKYLKRMKEYLERRNRTLERSYSTTLDDDETTYTTEVVEVTTSEV